MTGTQQRVYRETLEMRVPIKNAMTQHSPSWSGHLRRCAPGPNYMAKSVRLQAGLKEEVGVKSRA